MRKIGKHQSSLERQLNVFWSIKDVEIINDDGGKVYYPYQFNITVMEHLMDDGSVE